MLSPLTVCIIASTPPATSSTLATCPTYPSRLVSHVRQLFRITVAWVYSLNCRICGSLQSHWNGFDFLVVRVLNDLG